MKWKARVFYLLCIVPVSSVNATSIGIVDISGFLSVVGTQAVNDTDTSYNHGLAESEFNIDTYENRLGIQIAANISERIKATAQLLARGGDQYNYNVEVDWAYVDMAATKNLNFHVGKFKIPQLLVSDYADVGFAYPWIRPPLEVYGINPLISLSGISILYSLPIKSSKLIFQIFYGDGTHEIFIPSMTVDNINPVLEAQGKDQFSKTELYQIKTKDAWGGDIMWVSDSFTLHASHMETSIEVSALPEVEGRDGSFTSLGFRMDWHNVVFYSELISRDAKDPEPLMFPDQYGAYATIGYRIKSFLPYFTYGKMTEGEDISPLAIEQTSEALGFRVEINKFSAFKMEAIHVTPEEGNHGLFHEPVEDGMVYSAGVDVIF